MAENEEKKETNEGKVVTESTEGPKRKEDVDGFKRLMRTLREGGKIGFLLTLTIILAGCLMSKLNIWSLPRPISTLLWILFAFAVIVWYFSHSFKMIFAWENGVIFRLGRILRVHPKENQKRRWTFILWPFDKIEFVNMWERRIDIKPQKVILEEEIPTKEGEGPKKIAIEVTVDSIFYFKILDATKALTEVEDIDGAVHQLVRATLRNECAKCDIEELIARREDVSGRIQKAVNKGIKEWGAKITKAEFQEIGLPEDIQKALKRRFEAGQDKIAAILKAEGEAQAKKTVAEAEGMRYKTIIDSLKKDGAIDDLVKLESLTALKAVSDGKATKVFLPSDPILAAIAKAAEAVREKIIPEKAEEEKT